MARLLSARGASCMAPAVAAGAPTAYCMDSDTALRMQPSAGSRLSLLVTFAPVGGSPFKAHPVELIQLQVNFHGEGGALHLGCTLGSVQKGVRPPADKAAKVMCPPEIWPRTIPASRVPILAPPWPTLAPRVPFLAHPGPGTCPIRPRGSPSLSPGGAHSRPTLAHPSPGVAPS